jgi:hypothetical protein
MKMKCFIFCLALAGLFSFQQPAIAQTSETKIKVLPRIDEEAASIVKPARNATQSVAGGELRDESSNLNGNVYSQNFWMLLFGAYLFLLIFNLSFEFEKKQKLQWFLEAVLTFLAIYVWDNLDIPRTNTWFPGVVLESGIIIYAFYFFFLNKKLKVNNQS